MLGALPRASGPRFWLLVLAAYERASNEVTEQLVSTVESEGVRLPHRSLFLLALAARGEGSREHATSARFPYCPERSDGVS